MASSLKYTLHQYGTENDLQRVGVWDVDIADKSKYWIIYIHGGAWRDPRVTLETFAPGADKILQRAACGGRIAAFASLDYRLSPHPGFPQDPAATPPARLRGARHPDHVDDARAALAFLQARYGFGAGYVLVGHSAGGCMALQLVAGLYSSSSSSSSSSAPKEESQGGGGGSSSSSSSSSSSNSKNSSADVPAAFFLLPRAIVSLEGIYDFSGIAARLGPAYAEFLAGAFGGEEGWAAAAPVGCAGSFGERWPGGRLVLAWSRDDELVDEPEVDAMARRLRRDGVEGLVVSKDVLRGRHDEIWQSGEGIARLVGEVLRDLGGG
ncbi:hypothetical protein F5X99DRAFT_406895 [Biscogniauxia marginata]|nr:hypothetical protein F5X99DRAFT_406895 [Biscogniauxia marginata]